MKNNILKVLLLSLIVGVTVTALPGFAEEEKAKPAAEKKAAGEKKAGPMVFRGKIVALDKKAMTVSVNEREFQITSETKISKGGKPATLDDVAMGEEVGGSYIKGEGDKLVLRTIRVGPKPEGETKKKKE